MRILLSTLILVCLFALPGPTNAQTVCVKVVPELDPITCELIWPAEDPDGCFKDFQIECLKGLVAASQSKYSLCLDKGAEVLDGQCPQPDKKKSKKKRHKKKKRSD